MQDRPKTALVVDDEPLARLTLRDLLATTGWLRWAGEARNVLEAQEAVRTLGPDVVFLDISMPGRSGLDLANALSSRVAIVFTTAFDQYAVGAFELGAVDYLLKPFGQERFDTTVERLRARLDRPVVAQSQHLERLFARANGATHCILARDIEYIEAQDDYVEVHARGATYLVHMTLSDLERRLSPTHFWRVHRRHIVSADRVVKVVRDAGGGAMHLVGGAVVRVSRSRIATLPLRNS